MNWARRPAAGALYLVLMQSLMVAYPVASGFDDLDAQPGKKQVCALSDQQQEAAPKAFASFATMVKGEPRCNNCHGAVNPFLENTTHLGGTMDLSLRGKMGPDGATQSQCMECHNPPWVVPSQGEWFTNKNVIQLCRKMKSDFSESAQHFLNHVRSDQFSMAGFTGTRALNETGQAVYEEKRKAPYKIEPPKFTLNQLVDQAEAWVNAMGGKFVGDADCGCVPHHYTLSMDMTSKENISAGSFVSYLEQSAHSQFPLEFNDDGTFEKKDGQMSWTLSGYSRSSHFDCTIKGSIDLKFNVKGRVAQDKEVLHLVFSNQVIRGSSTSTCTNGQVTTSEIPGFSSAAPTTMSWDISTFVDVPQNVPMPYQKPPEFTSSMQMRINQSD